MGSRGKGKWGGQRKWNGEEWIEQGGFQGRRIREGCAFWNI
jgi:hypothetical protein